MFETCFDINLTKLTDKHLSNRLEYFKRMLAKRPREMIYIGDSVYAEDAVDAENSHNEKLAEDVKIHIEDIKKEIIRRKS